MKAGFKNRLQFDDERTSKIGVENYIDDFFFPSPLAALKKEMQL